jgi:hypothetical protein
MRCLVQKYFRSLSAVKRCVLEAQAVVFITVFLNILADSSILGVTIKGARNAVGWDYRCIKVQMSRAYPCPSVHATQSLRRSEPLVALPSDAGYCRIGLISAIHRAPPLVKSERPAKRCCVLDAQAATQAYTFATTTRIFDRPC